MTVEMLIKALRKVKAKHGNIDVYKENGLSPRLNITIRVDVGKNQLDKGAKDKSTHLEIG